MPVFKLALFDEDHPEPVWIGNIQDLREANPDDLEVEDAIQQILDGANEVTLGGGAAPLVTLRLHKED